MRALISLLLISLFTHLSAQSTMYYQTYNSTSEKSSILIGPHIDASGNIGIGRIPGLFKLDIDGSVRINSKIHPNDGNAEKYIFLNNSNFSYSTFTDHTWRIWRNSTGGYSNVVRFGGGLSREPYFSFNTTSAADDTTTVTIKANTTDGTTFPLKIQDSDNNVIFSVDSEGNMVVNGITNLTTAKGTATTTIGAGTTLVITHNLGTVPTNISITPGGDIGDWYVDTINSTTMTLNYTSTATTTASNVNIYWQVE